MAYDSDIKLAAIETNVDATVTSRLGAIAGIDRGTIIGDGLNTFATATVTAVVTGRSLLNYLGSNTTTAADNRLLGRLTLSNSTTIRVDWGAVASTPEAVSYELVEYNA